MAGNVSVGVYSLDRVVAFITSVETAVVMAKTMQGGWTPTDMNPLINVMYAVASVIGTVKPGAFIVTGVQQNKALVTMNVINGIDKFLTASARSPQEGATYLKGLDKQRKAAIAQVNGLAQSASSINAGVAKEAAAAARHAAEVSFAAALGGAAIGCVISLGAGFPMLVRGMAGGIGAAANIGGGYLKDRAADYAGSVAASASSVGEMSNANVYKALIVEYGKKGAEAGLTKSISGTAYGKAHHQSEQMQQAVAAGERKIEELNKRLGLQLKARARQKTTRKLAAATANQGKAGIAAAHAASNVRAASQTGMKSANFYGSVAHRGLPVIFLAFDVYDALGDLQGALDDAQ